MKHYILVDTEGYVRSSCSSSDEDAAPPSIDGCTAVEVSDPVSVLNAATGYKLRASDMQWVDTRTLAEVKVIKNFEINAARLSASRGTFIYAGKPISCDELSRSDIDGVNGYVSLTGALPPDWVGGWKAADNTYVPITSVADWTAFYGAMVARGTEIFAHSQALKAQLEAAETIAEVEAITWTA